MSIYLKVGISLLIFVIFVSWLILFISNKVMNNLIKESIDKINESYQEKYNRNATWKEIIANGIYPKEYYEKYLSTHHYG